MRRQHFGVIAAVVAWFGAPSALAAPPVIRLAGQPAYHAAVSALKADGDPQPLVTAYTDAAGQFKLALPPQTQVVRVEWQANAADGTPITLRCGDLAPKDLPNGCDLQFAGPQLNVGRPLPADQLAALAALHPPPGPAQALLVATTLKQWRTSPAPPTLAADALDLLRQPMGQRWLAAALDAQLEAVLAAPAPGPALLALGQQLRALGQAIGAPSVVAAGWQLALGGAQMAPPSNPQQLVTDATAAVGALYAAATGGSRRQLADDLLQVLALARDLQASIARGGPAALVLAQQQLQLAKEVRDDAGAADALEFLADAAAGPAQWPLFAQAVQAWQRDGNLARAALAAWRLLLAAHDDPRPSPPGPPVAAVAIAGQADADRAGDPLLAARIAVAHGHLLAQTEQWMPAEATLTAALARVDKLPASPDKDDLRAEAIGQLGRGLARERTDRCTEALPDLAIAETLHRKAKRPDQLATTLQLIGTCRERTDDFAGSRKAWMEAHSLFLADPSQFTVAIGALAAAAQTYRNQRPADVAAMEKLDLQGVQLARARKDLAQEARLLHEAGYAWVLLTDAKEPQLRRGIALLEQALPIHERLHDAAGETQDHTFLALAWRLIGRAGFAVGHDDVGMAGFEEALRWANRDTGSGEAEAIGDELALHYHLLGQWAKAEPLWQAYADFLLTPAAVARSNAIIAHHAHPTPADRELLRPERLRAVTCALLAGARWNLGKAPAAIHSMDCQEQALRGIGDNAGAELVVTQRAIFEVLSSDQPGYQRDHDHLRQVAKTTDQRAMLATLELVSVAHTGVGDLGALLDSTEQMLRKVLPEARRLADPDRLGIAAGWTMVGNLRLQIGQLRQGATCLQQGTELLMPAARIATIDRVALAWQQLGYLQRANDALMGLWAQRQSMAAFFAPSDQLRVAISLARLHAKLGWPDSRAAIWPLADALAKSLAQLPKPLPRDRIAVRDWAIAHGALYLQRGELAQATEVVRLATPMAAGDDVSARELEVVASVVAGDPARLQRALDQAIAAHATQTLAVGMAALGVGPKADAVRVQLLRQAERTALENEALADLPGIRAALAACQLRLGDSTGAQASAELARHDFEQLRGDLQADELKIGFFDTAGGEIYRILRDVYLQAGKPQLAFEASERGRGRAVLDLLAQATQARSSDALARAAFAEQLRGRKQAQQAFELPDALATMRVDRTDDVAVQAKPVQVLGAAPQLRPKLDAARAASKAKLATAPPPIAADATPENVSLVAAPAVQWAALAKLAKDRGVTVIEWDVSASGSVIFVVTPAGQVTAKRDDATLAQVSQHVAALRATLGVGAARGAALFGDDTVPADADAARWLYTHLVAPVAALLPADPNAPLLLVPQGPLFLCPFAALIDDQGKPFLASHTLAWSPALAVLQYTGHPGAGATGALAVGNPLMPAIAEGKLPPLPGAEAEAGDVALLLRTRRGLDVTQLQGPQATETQIRALLGTARVLHLATHGVVRDQEPLQSFVALAPSDKDDGLLTVREVLQLRVNAELVALSACQTGMGKLSGDGVLGFGRAFLYAGAPSVLVSLWSVDDEATRMTMRAFYGQWAGGRSKAAALRLAQLATRDAYPAPAKWAAFALWGEP